MLVTYDRMMEMEKYFIKPMKKIVDGADTLDIILFAVCFAIVPPIAAIWLLVRLFQEMED